MTSDERQRTVMQLLTGKYGYPQNGAAGLVGNLMAESGCIPNRIEGSNSSTPMRARDFSGLVREFTPTEIARRDPVSHQGPKLPGVGIAQWTSPVRRRRLFEHTFNKQCMGEMILFSLDAQVDYLVYELRSGYQYVEKILMRPGVSVNDACDEVVYNFEIPGAVLGGGLKLPRSALAVVQVFELRRKLAQAAVSL